jgi:tRNA threonylcarbamoyl adenosine modification protein YeaZ
MILLIDTSSAKLLVGLGSDDGTLVTFRQRVAEANERGIHDARLALEVSGILAEQEVAAKAVTRIGIVIGPGSFTGLRIGLAFAKGFASAWGAKIIPIVKHELLAVAQESGGRLLVTDGYQPALAYVAKNSEPKEVKLVKRAEMDLAGARTESQMTSDELMQRLLDLTILGEAANLASLEPLYLVDFAPTISK